MDIRTKAPVYLKDENGKLINNNLPLREGEDESEDYDFGKEGYYLIDDEPYYYDEFDEMYHSVSGGESYLPFDGNDISTMEIYQDDNGGQEFYYSADGENFYNAKGEKLKGFFTKVGGGLKKVGKGIWGAIKKVGHAVAVASKKVATGVKKVGGKIIHPEHRLIHHKKKSSKGGTTGGGLNFDPKKANKPFSLGNQGLTNPDRKPSGGGLFSDPDIAKTLGGKSPVSMPNSAGVDFNVTDATKAFKIDQNAGNDIFTKRLPLATPQTPKDQILQDDKGNQYSTENADKKRPIVQTTDENGKPILGQEYDPSQVVATTGQGGNIVYGLENDVSGMNKTLKYGLIIGGSLLVLGVAIYLITRKKK